MRFKAKSGIERELTITDRTLSRMVKRCQDLPGQHLFQYLDAEGQPHPVSSTDVNDYIREATGGAFTAKHFRTWTASVIAFEQLCAADEGGVGLNAMLAPVAEALGNTPAISRNPMSPTLIEAVKTAKGGLGCNAPAREYLSSAERGLIAFLASAAATRRP